MVPINKYDYFYLIPLALCCRSLYDVFARRSIFTTAKTLVTTHTYLKMLLLKWILLHWTGNTSFLRKVRWHWKVNFAKTWVSCGNHQKLPVSSIYSIHLYMQKR